MTLPTLPAESAPSPPLEPTIHFEEERLPDLTEEKRARERLSRQIAFGEGL